MLRRTAIVAGLAIGLAAAYDAAGQSTSLKTELGRPRVFNPFLPFSFSRLTVNPLGLPSTAGLRTPAASSASSEVVAAPAAALSVPVQAANLTASGSGQSQNLVVRPPYRPPVRSPYRPPPRPPF